MRFLTPHSKGHLYNIDQMYRVVHPNPDSHSTMRFWIRVWHPVQYLKAVYDLKIQCVNKSYVSRLNRSNFQVILIKDRF